MTSPERPNVAVVILNWNGIDHLKTYLPSVLAHTSQDVAIWVADNGSSDDSVAWLTTTHADRVHVLELGENFGFAAGYNRALAQIDAEVYVLLNSDVRIVESWIEPTLSAMDAQGWDVASPLIAQDVNPDLCEHAGGAGGFMDRDGFPFCAGRMFDSVEPVDAWLARDREVFWASGACFFIRKHAWLKVWRLRPHPVRPHGRNRFVLAPQKPGSQNWLRGSSESAPSRRGHTQHLKSVQDLPQLQEQPHHSVEEQTWLLALLHVQKNGLGWTRGVAHVVRRPGETILGRRPRARRFLFAAVFDVERTPSIEGVHVRPHPMRSVGGQKASPGRGLEKESRAFATWIHPRHIDIRQLTGLTRHPTFIAMTFCVPLRHGLVMRLVGRVWFTGLVCRAPKAGCVRAAGALGLEGPVNWCCWNDSMASQNEQWTQPPFAVWVHRNAYNARTRSGHSLDSLSSISTGW